MEGPDIIDQNEAMSASAERHYSNMPTWRSERIFRDDALLEEQLLEDITYSYFPPHWRYLTID
jgi:hypothetical protein